MEKKNSWKKNCLYRKFVDFQKPAIDMVRLVLEQQKYNKPSRVNVFEVYDEIAKNRIGVSKEIEEILVCLLFTIWVLMAKFGDMKIPKVANGKGK